MSKVAFLGLGAMGSRMAANLLKAGHELTVWNLTPAAANKLVASGVKVATTPKEAAEGNEFIIAMVSNDEASRHVWLDGSSGALAGTKAGAIAIESSTLTPAWVRELANAATQVGVALLDAMVSGSTPQAESAQLVFLVGGDAESLKRAEPLLKALGSSIQHAGPEGCGALEKDLGYTVKTAGGDAAVPTVSAVRKVFQRAIDENLGDLNMTAVVKLFDNEH
jgi:3-hydroxyisobutyrate dehydrogenase